MRIKRWLGGAVLVTVGLSVAGLAPGAGDAARASDQNDGGSGRDAGSGLDSAVEIRPRGAYTGQLVPEAGDTVDLFRFSMNKDAYTSVLVSLRNSTLIPDRPIQLLDPNGVVVDAGVPVAGSGFSASGVVTSDLNLRLSVHRAVVAGDYRLRIEGAEDGPAQSYQLCFMNCEGVRDAPIDTIFGGSLPTSDTQVLVVPPTHGDLGNPLGPTVVDYIDATLRGISRWRGAMASFADQYPQYSYLKDITIDVEVFDGVTPVDPAGYDVVLGYAAAGPAFRGVATDVDNQMIEPILTEAFGTDAVHYTGRKIVLSLFGASPRAGQVAYDFPEVTDLEMVTMHEFGHTFGLGHTLTWHPTYGSDLMNSPATFIYGDGSAVGDGGERTPMNCLSSLDLAGMAYLYRWLPSGEWAPSSASVALPEGMPYELFC